MYVYFCLCRVHSDESIRGLIISEGDFQPRQTIPHNNGRSITSRRKHVEEAPLEFVDFRECPESDNSVFGKYLSSTLGFLGVVSG
jgi:hypothetical protein